MFKKRSRPTSVRKAEVEDDDVPTPGTSEGGSGAATPTAEGQSVEEMMLLRKLRRSDKQQGIDLERLNRGEEKRKAKEPEIEMDKFGLQPSAAGAAAAKARGAGVGAGAGPDEDEQERLARRIKSNNFTQQTNALDADKHMMAFIDKEMAKRKGIAEEAGGEGASDDPQGALYALAERYRVDRGQVTEEQEGTMKNSLGMLSAIPEVDLGMENRLRNIEETEKAKRALLEKKRSRHNEPEDALAHIRFSRTQQPPREGDIQREMANAKREAAGLPARQPRERPQRAEMSTDEAVYERFKKRARR